MSSVRHSGPTRLAQLKHKRIDQGAKSLLSCMWTLGRELRGMKKGRMLGGGGRNRGRHLTQRWPCAWQ